MSRRFGRNQKRLARETIAAKEFAIEQLHAAIEAGRVLTEVTIEHNQALRDEIARAKSMVGPYSALFEAKVIRTGWDRPRHTGEPPFVVYNEPPPTNLYDLKSLAAAGLQEKLLLGLMGMVMFFVLHGYLLFTRGQTIGKRVVGIRIARYADGGLPPFWPLIAKRYAPIWVVGQIPVIGPYLTLIDALFIFRSDKRCLHDLLAGTLVVTEAPGQDRA